MTDAIREMIETHGRLYRKLETLGGPEHDGELFEEILGLEEEILTVMELPPAQRYRELLWGDDVDAIALSLDEARSAYLDRPIKDPVLVLVDAVLGHKDDPYNLLPMAGFTTSDFQLFMFSDKLLNTAGPAETDAILAEMRLAEGHLLDIALVQTRGIMANPALYWKLREVGIESLDEYLMARGGFDLDEDDMDGRQFFLRGVRRAGEDDPLGALADFTACLWHAPDHDVAYFNRGVMQEKLGDCRRAVEDYSHAVLLDPQFHDARCARAAVYAREGFPGRAIDDYSRVIEALPRDGGLYGHRGRISASLRRYEEALEDFTRAITLGVDEADLWYRRGLCHRALGAAEKAREDLETAAGKGSAEARGALGNGPALTDDADGGDGAMN